MLDSNTWNHLTVCKQMIYNNRLKNLTIRLQIIWKQNLTLHNLQELICPEIPSKHEIWSDDRLFRIIVFIICFFQRF